MSKSKKGASKAKAPKTTKAKAAAPAAPAKSGAMTKRDLINSVSEAVAASGASISKTQINEIITHIFASIKEEIVANGKYQQPRFGTFEVRDRAARTGKNPRTGEAIEIAASKNVGLKVSKVLKDSLNQ